MNMNDLIVNNSQLLDAYREISVNMQKYLSSSYKDVDEFIRFNPNRRLGDVYNSDLPMVMFDKSMIGKIVYLILDLNIKQKKLEQDVSLKKQYDLLYAQKEQEKEELSEEELTIYSRYYDCINEMKVLEHAKDYYDQFDSNSELFLRNFKLSDKETQELFEAFLKFVGNKSQNINLADSNFFDKLINAFAKDLDENEKERLNFALKTASESDMFFGDNIQLMLPVLKERVAHMTNVVDSEFELLKNKILNNPRLSHNVAIDEKLSKLKKKRSEVPFQQPNNDYFIALNKLNTALHREVNFRAIDELVGGKISDKELYNDLVDYCTANNIDMHEIIDYYGLNDLDVIKSFEQNTDESHDKKAKR